uniref:Putative secreted protein n=1 Tax=Anopheles darlingi TaxID=43151 RepID=A0A2M4DEW4_ANODA
MRSGASVRRWFALLLFLVADLESFPTRMDSDELFQLLRVAPTGPAASYAVSSILSQGLLCFTNFGGTSQIGRTALIRRLIR